MCIVYIHVYWLLPLLLLQGCERLLAFPFVLAPPAAPLAPPFTLELFVKVRAADVPATGAVLVGAFPVWYVSLRRPSSASYLQLGLYHAWLTKSSSKREDSVLYSEAVAWHDDAWHHLAVVVLGERATLGQAGPGNVRFFVNGDEISQGWKSWSQAYIYIYIYIHTHSICIRYVYIYIYMYTHISPRSSQT